MAQRLGSSLMGPLRRSTLLAVSVVWLAASPAFAILISVDADAYAPGTEISDLFDSVRLQTYYDNGASIGGVYSRKAQDPVLASTGTNVFGHAVMGMDAHGRPLNETWVFPQTLLVIEFYDPAESVSFDIIGDNITGGGDRAAVDVYDVDFNMIEWAQTPLMGYADFASVSIERGTFDISFIVTSGTDGAVYIDNLKANIIPEPMTLLLVGFGGILVRSRSKGSVRV